jgi:hypothetical protein
MAKKKKKSLSANEKRLKKILQQLSGDVSAIDGELIPEIVIRGRGMLHCYSPSKGEFVGITRGTAAYIIKELKDEKSLIYTFTGHVIEIETDELIFIGFD